MKKIALILILAFSTKGFSQDNLDSLFYAGTDTVGLAKKIAADEHKFVVDSDRVITKVSGPTIHQAQILSFIDKNAGKSVGKDGICWDLIDGAFRQWDKNWWEKKNSYGVQINHKDLLSGDIIETHGEINEDGSVSPNHIMFVYAVEKGGKIIVADQGKGFVVSLRTFNYDTRKAYSKKISIKCFRPE